MTTEAREAREAAFKKYREGFKIPQAERVDFNTAFDAGVSEGIRQAREAVAILDTKWKFDFYWTYGEEIEAALDALDVTDHG